MTGQIPSAGTAPLTMIVTADLLLERMKAGETLHHGSPPRRRRKGWWLEPSFTPVTDEAVKALRERVPTTETKVQFL